MHRRERGQSIAEVAIILPVALLLLAGTIDLGRLFFARVSIENAAREGAMFAATNPLCDTAAQATCDDPNTAEWRTLNEVSGLDGLATTFTCFNGATARGSVADCDQGDDYVVTVSDEFQLVTPLLEPFLGSTITLEASATSVVLNSAIDPAATYVPFDADESEDPTESPSDDPTDCTVGQYVGLKVNKAQADWSAALFTGAFDTEGKNNFNIAYQDLPPGTAPCDSSITVYEVAP